MICGILLISYSIIFIDFKYINNKINIVNLINDININFVLSTDINSLLQIL